MKLILSVLAASMAFTQTSYAQVSPNYAAMEECEVRYDGCMDECSTEGISDPMCTQMCASFYDECRENAYVDWPISNLVACIQAYHTGVQTCNQQHYDCLHANYSQSYCDNQRSLCLQNLHTDIVACIADA